MNKDIKNKKGWKLSTQFAFFTSILIFVIVVFMAGYSINFVKNLSSAASIQNKTSDLSVYALIFQIFAKDDSEIAKKEYQDVTKNLLSNRLIAYLIVVDKETQRIKWSSSQDLINAPFDASFFAKKQKLLQKSKQMNRETYEVENSNERYIVTVGFYSQALFSTNLDVLMAHMKMLVFMFLALGLLSAGAMSTLVIKPLDRLVEGVKKFGKGDMTNRLNLTPYSEINELVYAYNQMADELAHLYESLELKVKERTEKLEEANKALKDTQAMMVHSEKMRSLGELVAGITHEINNPVNFIYGNLSHLNNYSNDLMQIIDKMSLLEESLPEDKKGEIEEIKKEVDYDFIKSDLPDLIRSCKEGTERTKNIVLDLKNFSRLGEMALNDVNLEREIDLTLNILHNKYKGRITVHKEYEEGLPTIEGYGGQLNQVFMNVLDNAAYAIKETGDVYIRLSRQDKNVRLEIEDTGSGIDKEDFRKVFEPFFTTKPVGEGTGLGMSISYKVIKSHNGTINVESQLNKGTKFTIILPIKNEKVQENGKV